MSIRVTLFVLFLVAWLVIGFLSILIVGTNLRTLLIYTCGTGYLLLPILSLWPYMTVALPGVVVAGTRRQGGIPVGMVLVALGLLGFLAWSAVKPRWDVQRGLAMWEDHGTPPRTPRQLRLVEVVSRPTLDRPLDQAPCKELCQRLLFGGEVDAVEVRAHAESQEGYSVVYRRERRDVCPPAFARYGYALPTVRRGLVDGDCLVPTVGETLPDAPWIRLERFSPKERRKDAVSTTWVQTEALSRLTGGPFGSSVEQPAWSRHAFRMSVVQWPPLVWPEGGKPMGIDKIRWRRRTVALGGAPELEHFVPVNLGYRFGADVVADVPSPDLALVGRLLDAPGDVPFDAAQVRTVNQALSAWRPTEPLTDDEIEVLDRVLRDPRLNQVDFSGKFLESPTATAALVPGMVERFGMADTSRRTRDNIGKLLVALPPESVRPYGVRIAEIVEADGTRDTSAVLPMLPHWMDEMPIDLVQGALSSPDPLLQERGCHAVAAMPVDSVPETLKYRVIAVGNSKTNPRVKAAACNTLEGLGDDAACEALLANLDDRIREAVARDRASLKAEANR